MTLRDMRLLIGEQLKMTKKVAKSLMVRIGDNEWSSGCKTVGGMMKENLFKETDTLVISTGPRGGAGKRKVTSCTVMGRWRPFAT